MEDHQRHLRSLCRVCAGKLGRVSYSCTDCATEQGSSTSHSKLLRLCLGCNIELDDPQIHPPRFCNSCYLSMKRVRESKENGTVNRTSLKLFEWSMHQVEGCTTCELVQQRRRGGRPPKKPKIPKLCPTLLAQHIRAIAGAQHRCSLPLETSRFFPPAASTHLSIDDFVCKHCKNVVNGPVELPCKENICSECCIDLLRSNINDLTCLCCKQQHPLTPPTFQAPSPLTAKLLNQLVIRCDRRLCTKTVHLQDLKEHIESGCSSKCTTAASATLTVEQILDQPIGIPPTRVEVETAGYLVRKIIQQTRDPSISLPTGGCVRENTLFT